MLEEGRAPNAKHSCCAEASLISSRVYFHLLWNDLFIGLMLLVLITLEALLVL